MHRRLTFWLWAIVAGSLAWALLVSLTGGVRIDLPPLYFSSLKPGPTLALAVAALVGLGLRHWRALIRLKDDARLAPWLAVALATAVCIQTIVFGAHVAGGSDSWGYLSEAELILHGRLSVDQPIAATSPWPNAAATFCPIGYKQAPWPGAIVPRYAPGFPLVLALFQVIGGRTAVFAVVPLFAFVAVFTTYLLGARFAGRLVGLLGAGWLAASPPFVIQALQPMSDVPATAWWLLSALGVSVATPGVTLAAGAAAGMAILTRPNLAWLAIPFAVSLVRQHADRAAWPRLLAYGIGVGSAVAAVAFFYDALYGSPFRSGYGSLGEIFAAANVVPNLGRYLRWLISAESPLILAGVAAPWMVRSRAAQAQEHLATVRLWLAVTVLVWLAYLPYLQFESPTFLRFLLPSLPLMILLAVCVTVGLLSRAGGHPAPVLVLVFFVPFLLWRSGVTSERARGIREFERKFEAVGEYANRAMPPGAVLVSLQHSGSLRYYSEATTLNYQALDPTWLDRAVRFLERGGHEVRFVLEEQEEDEFRQRFAASNDLGRLDWPPAAEFNEPGVPVVRIYDPADRHRRVSGPIRTVRIPAGGSSAARPGLR